MKKLALILVCGMVFLLAACNQQPASARERSAASSGTVRTFTGEIMDSTCAEVGSHKPMLSPNGPRNAKQCTLKCVKMGANFVLYNRSTKTTYQLDDQAMPRPFAGEKVSVTGTFDASTKTIHVKTISAA